mmetsp:Transcript_45346/g.96433  ORF Transcript_45346/g.96433 Transcript_45346/m.96433 type:complete len:280 (-) Transcript_45346:400-1239(-)|eukprot:CAMPEP_0172552816 /NCGR_PEP_ID=MMETSP1067-20121228/47210_1 /TAXON_ID=265564 ORGANISM="Thalassiosira punctigera, Strain Tpunct2005C2" /NCGR_SAMPLE_ID=MMETSP1067 /ASSEMBLY_ACC=CAM_ASM_000444 /LENGTH=279 /DNA_ID=CAMNT_0013340877 /DNA_START=84 /DNA_END=923 /DNA_ORIENTATION=-
MRPRPATDPRKKLLKASAQILVALVAFGFLVSIISAQGDEEEDGSSAVLPGDKSLPSWQPAFVDLCATVAPCGAILCFLAPLPTILQISRDKTVGSLPLLPYSSMVANAFLWVTYGILKEQPSIWAPNSVGVVLGSFYFAAFVRHCGPSASDLPGTAGQHLRGTGAVVLFALGLTLGGAVADASEIIGKVGVFFCVVLFASPLAALKTVVVTKSAVSIPLPFTVACFVNCLSWSVLGWYKMNDFNIYFPNLLGLSCAVAQLALKGMYGNRSVGGKELPK